MHKVTSENELEQFRVAMLQLFQSTDPFDQPFRDEVKDRVILVTGNYRFAEDQFRAVAYAARGLGEEECAVSVVERLKVGDVARAEHWIAGLADYKAYRRIPVIMVNAVYSLQGQWGIIFSTEFHGVLGGSSHFMSAFKAAYPQWQEEREEFLGMWVENRVKYRSNVSWLPRLLQHVYGEVGGLPWELRSEIL